ncbi:MAG TPA: XdhC family protein, partial [Chloroflexota bacterium]|nr:XdhC family protein [Chloroflexota bacterium]
MPNPTALALDLLERRIPFCLATVVAAGAQAGVAAGAKMVVPLDGEPAGDAGRAALTEAVRRLAAAQLTAGEIRVARLSADGRELPERRSRRVGDLEPHEVEVALEPMVPPDQLVIFGAGHIGMPLARLAAVLGYEVTIVDDRER